jgi:acyl carrier protein
MNVIENIRNYMAKELNLPDARNIDGDIALVREGVIDSIELMQVVTFLEEHFEIEVAETEILPANFRSLNTMAAFIDGKLANR